MLPAGGAIGAKVALSRTAGSVLTTPRQFGPTIRMPLRLTISNSLRSPDLPSPATSANPALMTTTACTPKRAHSASSLSTAAAGTATTTKSTGDPTAETDG
jgi:hypothetical protein